MSTTHPVTEAPAWRVVAASIQGASHQRRGEPCQDAHGWSTLADGTLIAVVADGAGSAGLSDIGAQLAVHSAISFTREALANGPPAAEESWCRTLHGILARTRIAVEERADEEGIDHHELATTLIVAIVSGNAIAVAQIGDGAAVLRDNESLIPLTTPVLSEYLNETTFITSPGAVQNAQIRVCLAEGPRLALLSDGLQMLALKLPSGRPHPQFFDPLFEFMANSRDLFVARTELEDWMTSVRLSGRSFDDLTLLLAIRE